MEVVFLKKFKRREDLGNWLKGREGKGIKDDEERIRIKGKVVRWKEIKMNGEKEVEKKK